MTQLCLPVEGETAGPLFAHGPQLRPSGKHTRSKLYRRKVRQATPPWADKVKIRAIYKEAKVMTRATGLVHSVDHIIPLRGEFVWGLHVETNLRVVLHEDNMKKGNTYAEQLGLFGESQHHHGRASARCAGPAEDGPVR